jgi:translation initiation factor 2B subunit (eIF-2B alpha/beta/delta family)
MKYLKKFEQINQTLNDEFSERFAYQFIKPTDKLLTISESSELDDVIKTGKDNDTKVF